MLNRANFKLSRKISLDVLAPHPARLLLFFALVLLALLPGSYGETARASMAGAYMAVAVFVFVTLLAFYWLERRFDVNIIERVQDRPRLQIAAAALLGMMPGCGGAILVVTGYASGQLSYGALIATLTATMGDAAFLLLAEDPRAALIILPLSAIVGFVTGLIVDSFFPNTANRQARKSRMMPARIGEFRLRDQLMLLCLVPGLILGIAGLAQLEIPALGEQFALMAMLFTALIWALSPVDRMTHMDDHPASRANEETAFVMIWVLAAFLLFDMAQVIFGFDFSGLFSGLYYWTPLIAALVGFIPGCGPQILTTSLYLAGALPMGALLANAVANDGDALFPAIAITPRAALSATAITAIPAVILGYAFLLAG